MDRPIDRPTTDAEELAAVLEEEAKQAAAGEPEPEPEELLDLLAGRLSPEEEARLQRRIDASPAAARMLIDLADLEEAAAAPKDGPADLAVHAGWRDFQRRLAPPVSLSWRFPPILSSVAAALLVICAGLGYQVWTLQDQLRRPVGLLSLELVAGRSAPRTVETAPGGAVRLVLAPAERCPEYQAVITGPRTGGSRRVADLTPDELGRLNLVFRPEPGEYTLELSGCDRKLEDYPFAVVRPPAAGPGER